jgi:hypothetical protein
MGGDGALHGGEALHQQLDLARVEAGEKLRQPHLMGRGHAREGGPAGPGQGHDADAPVWPLGIAASLNLLPRLAGSADF